MMHVRFHSFIVVLLILSVSPHAHAASEPACDPADASPWGTLSATRRYHPPEWHGDDRTLERPTWFFVPAVAPVVAGQSGPFLSSLSWRDDHGGVGVCVYRGSGQQLSTSSCEGSGSEYRLAFCALASASGISFFGADGLIEAATTIRLDVENGDSCAPTTVALELLSPPDRDGDGIPDCLESARDTEPPTWPAGSTLAASTSGTTATLVWTAALDNVGVAGYRIAENGVPVAEVGSGTLSVAIPGVPSDGQVTLRVQAFDAAGNVSTDGPQAVVRVDGTPPTWPAGSSLVVTRTGTRSATLTWNAATDDVGVTIYRVFRDGLLFASVSPANLKLDVTDLDPEATVVFQVQAVDAAGNVSIDGPQGTVHLGTPDPALVAPPLDPTVSQTLLDSTAFLFSGPDPIQRDVTAGNLRRERAALVRGRVGERDGTAIQDVTIGILGHSEYGWTRTRADGAFDLVVNGGGSLVVTYTKNGYLPVQRRVDVPWDDAVRAPDVVLIKLDPAVTEIEVDAPSDQVARGSLVADTDGSRRMTLFIPANTTASMRMADGTMVPLDTMHVRATEYTVGPSGPAAMPGDLPPSSAYTYAAELSVDEAMAAGAKGVEFSQPVPVYVENFLGFPVGAAVPLGFYDLDQGAWIPAESGRVIGLLAPVGGLAAIDADGDGQPDSAAQLAALEISDAERAELGALYAPGQSLWRVRTTHFSRPDLNWGAGVPSDAIVAGGEATNDEDDPRPCTAAGSIIECENQILGDDIGITGTALTLHYQSERTEGRALARTAHIPVSGPFVPASLGAIVLDVDIAGQHFKQEFAPLPNQTTTFVWDGKDGYGRPVTGTRVAKIAVTYRYPFRYQNTLGFALPSANDFSAVGGRGFRDLTRTTSFRLGTARNAPTNSLGGWQLSAHHVYDLEGGVVYRGDGLRQVPDQRAQISASLGTVDLAAGPDGSIYYIDAGQVWRITRDGSFQRIAGTGPAGFGGDGGPALLAALNRPTGVAVGADNSVYILDSANFRVRRVDPFGFISTVVGNGTSGQAGDEGPATGASLVPIDKGLAVGRDGSIYIAERVRIRRVGLDGIIRRYAGSVQCSLFVTGCEGDNGPALDAQFSNITAIAAAPDGSLYVADRFKNVVRRIDANGFINILAGINNSRVFIDGEGVPAVAATLTPYAVKAGPDNRVYIAEAQLFPEQRSSRVRRVNADGTIETVAGSSGPCVHNPNPNFVAPLGLILCDLSVNAAVAVAEDGTLAVADAGHLYVAGHGLPNLARDWYSVPSRDRTELYAFDASGRHLRTQDTTTGALLARFEYAPDGQLSAIVDGDGNTLQIDSSSPGQTVLTAPFGQRTVLAMNADGYLAGVTDPLGQSVTLTYSGKDLLASLSDPLKGTSTFEYDADGRLTKDTNAGGGFKSLARSVDGKKATVTRTTALGRTTANQTDTTNPTVETKSVSFAGLQATSARSLNGTRAATYADGTQISGSVSADPRFGMDAPMATEVVVQTPSGRSTTATIAKSVTLSNPDDPLSVSHLQVARTLNGTRTWTTTYEAAGRSVTLSTPSGRQSSAVLDAQGRVVQSNEPGRLPRTFKYDGHGRLTQTQQGTRVVSLEYDSDGNVAHTTLPDGRDVRATYDAIGRPLSVTRPDGRTLQYAYELAGRRLLTVPPGRSAHAEEVNPEARTSTYRPPAVVPPTLDRLEQLDLDAQLQSRTNGNGEVVTVDRDSAGRPIHVNTPRGAFTYDYDAVKGHLLGGATPEGQSETYGYDGSHLMSVDVAGQVAGNVDFGYDAEDRLSTDTVDGQSVAYSYDTDNFLVQAGSMVVSRDSASGDVTGSSIENVSMGFVRNGYGEIDHRDAKFAGTDLYSADVLSRDGASRILTRQETVNGEAHTHDYSYDAAGRLTDAMVDGVTSSHYEYDENGNRLLREQGATADSCTYDAQDRLMSAGTALFTYTADGALETKVDTTTGATTSYTYDVRGSLTKVDLPTGAHVSYITDALGRRVGRTVNASLTNGWIYATNTGPAAELDATGRIVSRFVYAHRSWVPSYVTKDAGTYAIVTDAVGSVRLVVDVRTGAVAQRLDYDEFGSVIADTNPGFQPFGFGGGLYDAATGLVRFGARDYDAATGRWTRKDPLLFGGGDTNLWTYAGNDPINRIDPSGLAPGDPDPAIQCVPFEFGSMCYGGTGHATTRDVVVAAAIVGGACVAIVGAAVAAGIAAIAGTAEGLTAAGGVAGAELGAAEVIGAQATVTVADAISQGLVNAGGKLAEVLTGIEQGFANAASRTALEALSIVDRAAVAAGLEAGVLTSFAVGGDWILQNRGGVTTILGANGSILVLRGRDVLLRLLP